MKIILVSESNFKLFPFLLVFVLAFPGILNANDSKQLFESEHLIAEDEPLLLNGYGKRSKLFVEIYSAALYLPTKNTDANNILLNNVPMMMTLKLTSGLVTKDRLKKALLTGLQKSTQGNTSDFEQQINQILAMLDIEFSVGDQVFFEYQPAKGISVFKNKEFLGTVLGYEFKKAFFGIWLSNNPVQKSLKTDLLSGN